MYTLEIYPLYGIPVDVMRMCAHSRSSWQNHLFLEGLVSHKALPYNNIDNNMHVHKSFLLRYYIHLTTDPGRINFLLSLGPGKPHNTTIDAYF